MMRKYLVLTGLSILLIFWVVVALSQPDTTGVPGQVQESTKIIAWFATVIMGVVSVPLTTLMKKWPFINGWITIVANSVINIVLVLIFGAIFKWSIFDNPTIWTYLVQALGINQTVASIVFEAFKPKTT